MLAGDRLLIAIDGTAGAGKTTIGQMLAAMLALPYLDTGAMYRAVTLLSLRRNVPIEDALELAALARNLDFVSRDATSQEAGDGRQYTVLLSGKDVSQALRSPEVEEIVSPVAAIPQVRTELVARQREMAEQSGSMIMIGRDIGSVVLPQADLKVYLDASPAVRAQRRSQQETQLAGTEEARRNLEARDRIDSSRAAAPLVIPSGALVINTDYLTQQQVLDQILEALAKS